MTAAITKRDINQIIRDSMKLDELDKLEEAYVAQPKQYDLKTEMMLDKTKGAHLDLYANYIQSLNDVSAKLDVVNRAEANANDSVYRALKRDEARLLNAVHLHELFFANISDPYSEIGVDSYAHMRLTRDFGTFDDWQADFIAAAMSCRQGWVVTVASTHLKRYHTIIVDQHDIGVIVGSYPVIVLDMWEHSRRDYLNNKKDYIVAMMKELNWNVIEERIKRADLVLQVVQ